MSTGKAYCRGPLFVKYGECGEELKKWLIEVYKGPFAASQSSEDLPSGPTKWNQQWAEYNGLRNT